MSERVGYTILRLNSRYNLKVTIAYSPTTDHEDQEAETFYEDIKTALSHTPTHFNTICGDFNSKVGVKSEDTEIVMGKYGIGTRNSRGEMLVNFLLENNLYLMNSFFYKKPNRKWTWTSPDGKK